MRTQRARRCSQRRGGLCAELRGPSRLRPRPATPTATPAAGRRRPGGLSALEESLCGAEARVAAGVAAGLPAAHSGEPGGSGGPGVCRRERAFGAADGADWRRGGQLWSRCLPTWEPRDGRRLPHREAVTAVWDRLDPVAPGKAPRDVRAGFLPPRCSPLNPSAPLTQHLVLGWLLM